MKRGLVWGCITVIIIIFLTAGFPVMAAGLTNGSATHRWDIPDIITIFSTILAAVLSIISYKGYQRDQRSKFLLVTFAFIIFALKGVFIISADFLAYNPRVLFDSIASLLDFVVLGCIFLSITMK